MAETGKRGAEVADANLVDNLRSIVELTAELGEDVRLLVEYELLLARQRLREMLHANLRAIGLFAGAGLAALMGLILVFVTVIEFVPPPARPWISLLLTLLLLGGAGILGLVGRRMMRTDFGQVIRSFLEDLEWAKRQTKPDGS